MTPLRKGHKVKKRFRRNWTVTENWWDRTTGTGADVQEWKLHFCQTEKMSSLDPDVVSGWVNVLAFGAVKSTSRESLDRTTGLPYLLSPQAFHLTAISLGFRNTFAARLGQTCKKHCYNPQHRNTSENALIPGYFLHVAGHLASGSRWTPCTTHLPKV